MTQPHWITLFLDVPAGNWRPAVEFWAAVTGCEPSSPRGERGQFLALVPRAGDATLVGASIAYRVMDRL